MPVYFIRAGETGPVKIGWTKDVEDRRKILQTSQPELLQVIRVVDGTRSLERWLHDRFAALRLVGEWFRFDADMLAITLSDLEVPPAKRPRRRPLVSWAAEMCWSGNLCQECRTDPAEAWAAAQRRCEAAQ